MTINSNTSASDIKSGPYLVYVHLGLADDMAGRPDFRRRCNMRFRDMAARGALTKVKGLVGDTNRGWLRTPLGGNGGNQYYLYWTRTGLPATPKSVSHDRYPDAFWVRTVRHHDDHSPLSFGNPETDYYPFTPEDIADDDLFTDPPWTEEQKMFFENQGEVNLLYGHPGSGKTTSLLKVIEDSHGEFILFSTWSRELASLGSGSISP